MMTNDDIFLSIPYSMGGQLSFGEQMLLHLLLLFISPWISHPLNSLVQVNPLWLVSTP